LGAETLCTCFICVNILSLLVNILVHTGQGTSCLIPWWDDRKCRQKLLMWVYVLRHKLHLKRLLDSWVQNWRTEYLSIIGRLAWFVVLSKSLVPFVSLNEVGVCSDSTSEKYLIFYVKFNFTQKLYSKLWWTV